MIITNKIAHKTEPRNYDIIVSMTTWKKRIDFIEKPIESICNQTAKIYKFYLVLSLKEFPDKKIPDFIIEYLNKYDFFEILWVENNIKQFKKNLPVLEKYWNRNDVVIFTADDDIYYKENYIATLYDILRTENENTILTYNFGWPLEKPVIFADYNKKRVIGKFEILIPSFFNNKIVLNINEDDIKDAKTNWISEDWWISYNLLNNNKLQWKFLKYEVLYNLIEFIKDNEINPLENYWIKITDEEKLSNVIKLYNKKQLEY